MGLYYGIEQESGRMIAVNIDQLLYVADVYSCKALGDKPLTEMVFAGKSVIVEGNIHDITDEIEDLLCEKKDDV